MCDGVEPIVRAQPIPSQQTVERWTAVAYQPAALSVHGVLWEEIRFLPATTCMCVMGRPAASDWQGLGYRAFGLQAAPETSTQFKSLQIIWLHAYRDSLRPFGLTAVQQAAAKLLGGHLWTVMDSGSEDGEIVGEVNENFDKADYVQHSAPRAATDKSSSKTGLALLQQLLPGWDDEPDGAADGGSAQKRKPKKEKKHKKLKREQSSTAAGKGSPAEHGGDYRSFYGANVSCRWLLGARHVGCCDAVML